MKMQAICGFYATTFTDLVGGPQAKLGKKEARSTVLAPLNRLPWRTAAARPKTTAMTCSLIMTANPHTVPDSETVGEAARILVQHRCNHLPVVDAQGIFIGMFGLYDLMNLLIPKVALAGGLVPNLRFMGDDPEALRARFRDVRSRAVSEVAERDIPVLHPDTPEIEALRLFCLERTTLPVVERGTKKLVGIVSYWDALRAVTGIRSER